MLEASNDTQHVSTNVTSEWKINEVPTYNMNVLKTLIQAKVSSAVSRGENTN